MDRAAPGEADEVLYYHTDVNGAPEEMTDGGGNIVWEAGYQVWGNLTHEKETRPVQQNLRFQGQYLDRETGCITICTDFMIRISGSLYRATLFRSGAG